MRASILVFVASLLCAGSGCSDGVRAVLYANPYAPQPIELEVQGKVVAKLDGAVGGTGYRYDMWRRTAELEEGLALFIATPCGRRRIEGTDVRDEALVTSTTTLPSGTRARRRRSAW